ncbi:MAG TPA: flagellar hook basal-body protein [Allosphingosinicella sp.]
MGLIDIAAAIMSQSGQRVELAAQNVSNVATPGYKKHVGFSDLLSTGRPAGEASSVESSFVDFAAGKQIETGNELDLALGGSGFFVVSSGDGLLHTRHGQFQRDPDGRLLTGAGFALQARGGGDLVLRDGPFEVGVDGVVLQDGTPVGSIAVESFENLDALTDRGGGYFNAASEASAEPVAAMVRQGALEASNVSTGEEMVAMMASLRRAEAAQRLINTYDELMGRALSAFGQA